jgi:hypothetical protein
MRADMEASACKLTSSLLTFGSVAAVEACPVPHSCSLGCGPFKVDCVSIAGFPTSIRTILSHLLRSMWLHLFLYQVRKR